MALMLKILTVKISTISCSNTQTRSAKCVSSHQKILRITPFCHVPTTYFSSSLDLKPHSNSNSTNKVSVILLLQMIQMNKTSALLNIFQMMMMTMNPTAISILQTIRKIYNTCKMALMHTEHRKWFKICSIKILLRQIILHKK